MADIGADNEFALSDLVDHRREEPDVEYKAWMDLASPEAKAKIAKHICALANYGGGWIIFGVANDGTHCKPHPSDLQAYSQDIVNGIVEKYLVPLIHCSVRHAKSRLTGEHYPVIQVPSHGTTPICGKTNGPLVGKVTVGVLQGTHYIRVPGPKSVPITSFDMWQSVIHRCVINERDGLLSSIGRLFDHPTEAAADHEMDNFISSAVELWGELILPSGWLTDPKLNHYLCAFRLLTHNNKPLPPITIQELKEALRQASHDADLRLKDSYPLFLQAAGDQQPAVYVLGNEDGLEARMVTENGAYLAIPALWRASTTGGGVEVRALHEDSEWTTTGVNQRRSRKWVAGERFVARWCAEMALLLTLTVRAFARHFPEARFAELRLEYRGLSHRTLDDPRPGVLYGFTNRRSIIDARQSSVRAPIEGLAGIGAAQIATMLAAPIVRLFDGQEIKPEYVASLGACE